MILLFGGNGQLGQELATRAAGAGIALAVRSRAATDIADPAAVASAIDEVRPTVIINAGAYTKVDKAEAEPDDAMRANADGPLVLASASASKGLPLLHFSTDYVFDGTKVGPYRESDPVSPLGVYGLTKLKGEEAIRSRLAEHVILRTSWVYGRFGGNFLKTMLRLADQRDELKVVADQRGCPTATRDLADAVIRLAPVLAGATARWGTYHFAGTGETTWHAFADRIVATRARFTGRSPRVTPIGTADYPTPARRPANSALDSTLFADTFGFRARRWEEATDEAVMELHAAGVTT